QRFSKQNRSKKTTSSYQSQKKDYTMSKPVTTAKFEDTDYCIPTFEFGCDFNDMIDDFILFGDNGSAINDVATGCADNSYDDRTDESVDLHQGYDYVATVVSGTNFDRTAIWIDFDDNGVFEESERVGAQDLDEGNDVSITIPESAGTGEHRMRVMVGWNGDPTNPDEFAPCNDGESPRTDGEVHDYSVIVLATEDCTGTPNAGEINAEESFAVCQETPIILTVTGTTQAFGVLYQWQQRPEGEDTYTCDDIDEADGLILDLPEGITEATDFRLHVECEESGESATTSPVSITLNPENECYCIPSYTTSCSSDDQINNVYIQGESITL